MWSRVSIAVRQRLNFHQHGLVRGGSSPRNSNPSTASKILSRQVRDVHVALFRFYSDSELETTAQLKGVSQHSFVQDEFEMEALVNIGEVHDG